MTLDWEGAYIDPDGLATLAALRREANDVPLTHFVSAAYFTQTPTLANAAQAIHDAVRADDEVAMHVHAWGSLARAAGLVPKLSPSFLTGTDKLLEFPSGDAGFDLDLDTYETPELRAILRVSRKLLVGGGFDVSASFRAGGYLATPKVLAAIAAEGYTTDSSAIDPKILGTQVQALPNRLRALWPTAGPASQPYRIAMGAGSIFEVPIAAALDYITVDEAVRMVDELATRRSPNENVVVVFAFHQETLGEFAPHVRELIKRIHEGHGDEVAFTTIEKLAALSAR